MAVNKEGQAHDRAAGTSLRPAGAEDEAGLRHFYAGLGRHSLKCRFHCEMNSLPASHVQQLSRLGGLDASQVQTFVALAATGPGDQPAAIIGHAGWRVDGESGAEFALVVADAHQGQGLGQQLMQALIASARQQGLRRLHAPILHDNLAMLRMLRRAAIAVHDDPEDRGLVTARLDPQHYRAPALRLPARPLARLWWTGWLGWPGAWAARGTGRAA